MGLFNPAVIGGPLPGATQGSVLFGGPAGVFAQDNANFNFDDATNSLFLGGALLGTQVQGANKRVATIQPTSAGHGPWIIHTNDALFSPVYDPVLWWGYNLQEGATPELPGEPGLSWVIEADYWDGSRRWMEAYLQYVSADTLTNYRPLFFGIRRDTDVVAYVKIDGPVGINTTNPSGGLQIVGIDSGNNVLGVIGSNGQTSPLIDVTTFGGANRFRVDPAGLVSITSLESGLDVSVTPTASAGAFISENFQIDTTGLTGSAAWYGVFFNRIGTTAPGAFFSLRDLGNIVYHLDSNAELTWKPLGLSGFGSMKYDGANTNAIYGYFRATNAQDGINFRNAFTADDGTGVGFRFSVTDNSPYSAVTNKAAKILVLGTGQGGFAVDVFSVTAGGHTLLTAGAATVLPLEIVLAASQSANAFEVRASNGTTKLSAIDPTGRGSFGTGPLTGTAGLVNDAYSRLDLYGFGGAAVQFVAESDPGVGNYAFAGFDFVLKNPDAPTPHLLTFSFGADGVYNDDGSTGGSTFYIYDWTTDNYALYADGDSSRVVVGPTFAQLATAPVGQLTVFSRSNLYVPIVVKSSASLDATQWKSEDATITFASISSIGAALFRPRDAATNTVTIAQTLGHASSGTPAAGYGGEQRFQLQSSTTANRDAAAWRWLWNTATDASRKADLIGLVWDTAEREFLRARGSGSAAMLAVLGATPIARPSSYTLAGSATRTFPTDPSGAYTGINNLQAGTVYATVADLNTLRGVVSALEGVVRQLTVDMASTSGFGWLAAA